jgi:hypothetical protein
LRHPELPAVQCRAKCGLIFAFLLSGWLSAAAAEAPQAVDSSCTTPRLATEPELAAPAFRIGEPAVVLTTADMDQAGLMFPDSTLGVVRFAGANRYVLFGASGSFGGVGKTAHLPNGTYRFEGSLERLAARVDGGPPPAAALAQGSTQPSPDGSDFDRDYAGGGPTYPLALDGLNSIAVTGAKPPSGVAPLLLQIYHGEFDAIPGVGQLAYGGSGFAISRDQGKTFTKIGQILAPHVSREDFFRSGRRGGLWADASMIEADARGRRISPAGAPEAERERYFYLILTDHHQPQERCIGLSIARISKRELSAALHAGRVPQFEKFYRPSPTREWQGGDFSQPGVGGDSTPIIAAPGDYINSPSIAYDGTLDRYVLTYQVNQKQIRISTSDDLLHWSKAQVIAEWESASSKRVFYPTLVGSGDDPAELEKSFYVYFLERDRDAQGRFTNPRLLRVRLESGEP